MTELLSLTRTVSANPIPDRIGERVQQVAGGGQRKRFGPSEPRANAAEIEPQKEGFYSDPSGAR